ncbi:hypothetical protein UPYG_G00045380 [Umbra pygmaea]|uniref:SH3 domain-containing protein n=1 Tax=Umbra pygmaea TaxID=75934 RepID=A0ABD0YEW6_UMBPY
MAESQIEEEELRDMQEIRSRNQATDQAERNKPEGFHSSQGPLSSIRAAIKRTRTSSPSEKNRDRRRPDITILSAGPLAASTWFPGSSGEFTATPPPTQLSWGGSIQTDAQLPPSYEQVIKEKTQETVVTPTAAPRRLTTTTIATQTVLVDDDSIAGPECSAVALKPTETNQATVKVKPQKPPRPDLPKPLQSDSSAGTAVFKSGLLEVDATTTTTASQHSQSASISPIPHAPPHITSITVHWDVPVKPSEPSPITTDSSKPKLLLITEPVPTERPTPLPRLKSRKQSEVQTLIRLGENGSTALADKADEAPQPGKYLQELIDAFHPEDRCNQNSDSSDYQTPTDGSDQSCEDADGEMSTAHSQRNIRARIEAFESQEGGEESEFKRPEPRPRNMQLKPPVISAKPAPTLAPKPSFNRSNVRNNYQEPTSISSGNSVPSNPAPAPRPLLPIKPSFVAPKEVVLESPGPSVTANTPQMQLSIADRAKILFHKEEDEPRMVPPTPPEKPQKEPPGLNLNQNNHNSSSIPQEAKEDKEYTNNPFRKDVPFSVDNPFSMDDPFIKDDPFRKDDPFSYVPAMPLSNPVGGGTAISRPTVTRRPTTIRVPSTSNLLIEDQDSPPPLPAQMPVGSLPPPPVTRKQNFSTRIPSQDLLNPEPVRVPPPRPGGAIALHPRSVSFQSDHIPGLPPRPGGAMLLPPRSRSVSFDSEPIPGLPPRPGGGKVPPTRPPPAKAGPGRPPQPRADGIRQTPSIRREPTPSVNQFQAQKPKRKGPILPPRPNPGHRLYNSYMLELPHGIAEFDYNGREAGELSFQKNEVMLLVEQLDSETFECQVGDIQGTVQKSHMKIITPLSSLAAKPAGQGASPVGSRRDSNGLQVQALHDFTPEGPGELGLRAGDVVTNVEQVDSEWYRGSCRGSAGFFPISFVKVLSSPPTPVGSVKARRPSDAVSGPRCVARFDFDGEQSDELTFSEGDVIQLKEYVDEEWARGQIGTHSGVFPLSFVDIVEDLPPPPQLQRRQSAAIKVAMPGMVSSTNFREAAKPLQAPTSAGVEWAVAQYDYEGQSAEDLSFQQGDRILVTQNIDTEWCSGRLNGREGFFPRCYVQTSSGRTPVLNKPQAVPNGVGARGKALYNFTAESDEELSMKVGDIVTNLESIDSEWFIGELRGKRALLPKNYVQVLA